MKPETEKRVQERAAAEGVPVQDYLEGLIERAAGPSSGADNTLDLFAQWEAEDPSIDCADTETRNREWEELKGHLEANRFSIGIRRP